MHTGTAYFRPVISSAKLIILEQGAVSYIKLDKKVKWTMGRKSPGNQPDISLRSQIVSRRHGEFICLNGTWFYQYSGSLNATFYNGARLSVNEDGQPKSIRLHNGDMIRIDFENLETPDSNGVMLLFSTDAVDEKWDYYELKDKKEVVIGREKRKCNIVQALSYVSAKHAKITYRDGRYYLSDCGSAAGTWINGHKVQQAVRLREKDKFSICDRHFIFTGCGLMYCRCDKAAEDIESNEPYSTKFASPDAANRPDILKATIHRKVVPDQNGHGKIELIRDVQLTIQSGSLVALLGGSGAGKSTVMNCLNGMDQQGVEGEIIFLGENLYQTFDRMKYLIGNVPQKNEIHEMLSVEEELRNAAGIRLPADTKRKEIEARIDQTLHMLNLTERRKTKIHKLSGGEQKRVNIGVELVADRTLLCLDEPDAGLDPATKKELFSILKKLTRQNNKSILVIIHDVAEINMFDQVVMMAKVHDVGRMAFFGTPQQAIQHFEVANLKDAYEKLAENPEKYIRSGT